MTFNEYKSDLVAFFKDNYQLDVQIENDITAGVLPLPHLKVTGIKISALQGKMIYEGGLSIYPNYQILMGKDIAKYLYKIKISNSNLDIAYLIQYAREHEFFANIQKTPRLELEDIEISFGYQCVKCIKIDDLNFTFSHYLHKVDYIFDSSLSINREKYKIAGHVNGVSDTGIVENITITMENDDFVLQLLGNGDDLYNDPHFSGETSLKINNLKKFFAQVTHTPLRKKLKEKTHAVNLFQEKNITLSSKTVFKDDVLSFYEIQISDAEVTGLEALIEFSFSSSKIESYYNISATSVDLDYLTDTVQFDELDEILSIFHRVYSIKEKKSSIVDVYLNMNISQIKLLDGSLSDLSLKADIIDRGLYINQIAFSFPGLGKFALHGHYFNNRYRPEFKGNLHLAATNLSDTLKWLSQGGKNDYIHIGNISKLLIKSELSIIPHRVKFDHIKAALDSMVAIGKVNLIQDASLKTTIESALRFNQVNLDTLNLNNTFDDFIKLLIESDSDKSGSAYFKKVNDNKWLRYLKCNWSNDIMIEKAIFKGNKIKKLFVSAEIAPGNIAVNNISFSTDTAELKDGGFKFALSGIRPKIDLHLNFGFISKEFLTQIFPMELLSQNITDTINTFSLFNFDGQVKLNTATFVVNDTNKIDNISTVFELNDGDINLLSSKADILSGEISMLGSITAANTFPQMNVNFALNNINPEHLFSKFTKINKIKGYMSMSGALVSSGDTWERMISRIQGKIQVIGKNIKWSGMNLDEIAATPSLNLGISDKVSRLNYYTNYGTSFFQNLKGMITVDGTLLSLNNISLSNSRISGALSARYDLSNNMINSIAKYSFIPVGAYSAIIIGVQTTGQADNANVEFDLKQLNQFIQSNTAPEPPQANDLINDFVR